MKHIASLTVYSLQETGTVTYRKAVLHATYHKLRAGRLSYLGSFWFVWSVHWMLVWSALEIIFVHIIFMLHLVKLFNYFLISFRLVSLLLL